MADIYELKECPDCASPEIIHNEHRQQVICKDCGLIYEELTPREEKRYLGVQQNNLFSSGKKSKKRIR